MEKNYKGKRITVLGLGISGYETAKFFARQNAEVMVVDDAETVKNSEWKEELLKLGVQVYLKKYDREKALSADMVVTSPGVPLDNELLREAKKRNIPVKIEIEIAAEFSGNEIIGVTGTNGKSTVTSMIRHMLNACGYPAISCGNIGNPFIGEILGLSKKVIVVIELSSFQLARMEYFRPKVGVLLNITPDHVDWHGSLEAYTEAKFLMFKHQKHDDFAVINSEIKSDKNLNNIPSQIYLFQKEKSTNPNVCACLEIAKLYGIEMERAIGVFEAFRPLEHRMEIVVKSPEFTVINDSKSTNIASLEWALNQSDRPLVLIAGGRNKDAPFELLAHLVEDKVDTLVTIGETRDRLLEVWKGVKDRSTASSLKDAVATALSKVDRGGTVLFSPACKSFDMFLNYEDRGRKFKVVVLEAVGERTYV